MLTLSLLKTNMPKRFKKFRTEYKMPELPEVETTVRGLQPLMEGQMIQKVTVRERRMRVPVPVDLEAIVSGQKVKTVWRRAKYALMDLANGFTVIVHLGMSGRLVEKPVVEPVAKHDHVIFHLGGSEVRFNDARRFGMVTVCETEVLKDHALFRNLGPEPLSRHFTPEDFHTRLQKRTAPIKNVLMDNSVVVGVGNIYANEALFRSKIHPERQACDVTYDEAVDLHMCVVAVLAEAIQAGGTTLRDYVQADGALGYFHEKFAVYDRTDLPCVTKDCASTIVKTVVGQRGTFYCPQCQPLKKSKAKKVTKVA